ncbi:anti-sigma factor [Demequina sp. NBRC 110056]|uniref:anti-sigma factor family protein n=1 Tax=Demequina sp. NBRC 110056 TaxID=1570345 RepID=UPI00117D0F4E|nr:zf-HC2 domain-containing protein [Demequina sp. NBRC 110056]
MSEQHLGELVHDLLDNRLSPAQAAQAMHHLEDCAECRQRWDDLRAAREALKTSEAGIDLSFAQQLLDRERMAQIAQGESKQQARAARPPDRRPMLAVAAVVALLAVVVSAGYVAGEPSEVTLEFAEPEASIAASSAVVQVGAQGMRSGDQLRSWVHPDWEATDLVPVEAEVLRAPSGENILVATMLARLEPILVTEQHGRLSPLFAEYYASVDLGHAAAYVIGEQPRQLVWQTGDVVISVTCTCTARTLEAVAQAFPAHGEPNFVDRVTDGLGEIADLVTPDA